MTDDGLLSRGDISAIKGVGDDVLQFWLRNDLLQAEPAEPRKHRRFKPSEARIAKVLAELRRCGANISAMRALAASLRNAVAIAETSGLLAAELPEDPYSDEFDVFARAWESFIHELADPEEKVLAMRGLGLLTGEGLLRLYQDDSDRWVVDDADGMDRLPVNSVILFDFWKIFDNVRPDLEDLHR